MELIDIEEVQTAPKTELAPIERAALAETAPVQEPVYAFRRKGMDDFCTCNKARFDELASKPHLFETAIFYTAQPRKAVKLSDIAEAEGRP